MIVTAQMAHDFCLMAATVIPVLILARFLGARSPLERQILQGKHKSSELIRDAERVNQEIAEQRARLGKVKDDLIATSSHAELDDALAALTTLQQTSRELELQSRRSEMLTSRAATADKQADGLLMAAQVTMMLFMALGLAVGLAGEFFALLGSLAVIDRYWAIAISFGGVAILMGLLAQYGWMQLGLNVVDNSRWPVKLLWSGILIGLIVAPFIVTSFLGYKVRGTP